MDIMTLKELKQAFLDGVLKLHRATGKEKILISSIHEPEDICLDLPKHSEELEKEKAVRAKYLLLVDDALYEYWTAEVLACEILERRLPHEEFEFFELETGYNYGMKIYKYVKVPFEEIKAAAGFES